MKDSKTLATESTARGKLVGSIGRYVVSQGVAQAIAFLTGILIVRSMPKQDYAYYSIAVSMIAATALVAESGLNSALMSRGASVRDDKARLSSLFVSGMRFRFISGIPIVLIGTSLVCYLLLENGLVLEQAILCSAIVLCTLWSTVTTGTIQTFHRLDLQFDLIRNTSLVVSGLRLLLVAGLIFAALTNAPLVLAVSLACALGTNLILKHFAARRLDFRAPRNPKDRSAFGVSARRTIPMTLMLVASEQSILFFLSIRGTPEVIANVSALARFSIVFTIVNLVVVDIAAPMFARTEADVKLLLRRFLAVAGSYTLLATGLVVLVGMTAPLLLKLLGERYAGLELALLIVAAGSAVLNIGYALSSLNQARGWTKYSWIYIPLIVVWAVLGLSLIRLDDTVGAAIFIASQALPGLVTQCVRFIAGLSHLKRETGHPL